MKNYFPNNKAKRVPKLFYFKKNTDISFLMPSSWVYDPDLHFKNYPDWSISVNIDPDNWSQIVDNDYHTLSCIFRNRCIYFWDTILY